MGYELRTYQQKQVDFLRQNENRVRGIQSPTGTGKSIMILSYIKEYMKRFKDHTVILTTGFNNLVFQMEEDAKSMGINTQVLIGAAYLKPNCDFGDEKESFEYAKVNNSKCRNCPRIKYKNKDGKIVCDDLRPTNCSRMMVAKYISSPKNGILIITNHSYYLTMKDRINCNLLVVDEAHTFSDFYSGFRTYRLSKDIKMIVDNYCKSVDSPTSVAFRVVKNDRKIPSRIISNAIREMVQNRIIDKDRADKYENELVNLYSEDENSFVEADPQSQETIKYGFYHSYDINCSNVILMSATLDDYTLRMFGLRNRNQIYVQKEPLDRYVGSTYSPIAEEYYDAFPRIVEYIAKHCNSGLFLTTTIANMEWTIENFPKYNKEFKIFKDVEEYKKSKSGKKILVGSKKLFQGINVPDLDFVVLDKLPFATYDNKFKAYEFYLKKNTKCDPWLDYTMPLVKNSLLQACGRLWRQNDYENKIFDNGIFILTDPRLKGKFSNLKDMIVKMKPGIKLIEI